MKWSNGVAPGREGGRESVLEHSLLEHSDYLDGNRVEEWKTSRRSSRQPFQHARPAGREHGAVTAKEGEDTGYLTL